MTPIAWSTAGRPAVLFGCTRGSCDRTESVSPTRLARKVPEYMTPAQFAGLRAGSYWPEIAG